MTRSITVLGSGCALSPTGRPHASLLVRVVGAAPILVDAGDGVSRALAEAGHGDFELGAIVVSHLHADHAGGLPGLVQRLRLAGEGKRAAVPLLVPDEALPELHAMLRFFGMDRRRIEGVVGARPLETGRPHDLPGGLRLRALTNAHLPAGDAPALTRSYSFLFSHQEHHLYVSGDLADAAEVRRDAAGVDLAVIDALHVEPEAGAEAALAAGARRVLLTHRCADRRPCHGKEGRVGWAEQGETLCW